jgi:cell division protease FtsH
MTVLLGGRAAERLVFGEVSTGAADDLAKATEIARSMVARFGMDPKLGEVAYEPERSAFLQPAAETGLEPRRYGEQTAAAIDEAVRQLIESVSTRAFDILSRNRAVLDRAAQALLSKETLQGPELEAITATVHQERPATQAAA